MQKQERTIIGAKLRTNANTFPRQRKVFFQFDANNLETIRRQAPGKNIERKYYDMLINT